MLRVSVKCKWLGLVLWVMGKCLGVGLRVEGKLNGKKCWDLKNLLDQKYF